MATRIEAVAHNTQELDCARSVAMFPELILRLKGVLEGFANALSCIDQCFIADDMLEQLPLASCVGRTIVGGIDLNKTRMRRVVDAVIALSPSPNGFTASDVAARVCACGNDPRPRYSPRHAAYDLKKLRGKQIICRIGRTRRHQPLARWAPGDRRSGHPAQQSHQTDPRRRPTPPANARPPNPKPMDAHYETLRDGMRGVFVNSGSPLDYRQKNCRGFDRSA